MTKTMLLGAACALVTGIAAAQGIDPAAPTQLTKTGVAGWSQAAGIDPGHMEFLGATREGVFYSDPTVRVRPGGVAYFDVRLERFAPKGGGRGGVIRSERATVEIDCPRQMAKVGDVTGHAEHNLKGRSQDADEASWAIIGGDDWVQVARGNLLFPGRADMCRAAGAARGQAVDAAQRNKARDARQDRDARTNGLPGRPGAPKNRY